MYQENHIFNSLISFTYDEINLLTIPDILFLDIFIILRLISKNCLLFFVTVSKISPQVNDCIADNAKKTDMTNVGILRTRPVFINSNNIGINNIPANNISINEIIPKNENGL